MVWGMLFGMAVGVVMGSITGRMGLWLPISLLAGLMLSIVFGRSRKGGGADDSGAPPPA